MIDNSTQAVTQTEDVELQNEIRLEGEALEAVQAALGRPVDLRDMLGSGGPLGGPQQYISVHGSLLSWPPR